MYYQDTATGAVAVATIRDNVATVEAWQKLALAAASKAVDLQGLQSFLSSHGCSLEIAASPADAEWVAAVDGKSSESGMLEASLKKVEKDLAAEEKGWLEWKGVRDLDKAHENLQERQDQIFDLNQKIVWSVKEPQFIYHGSGPPRRTVSAFQQFDRLRYHELKYQARERASAIRQRIDFTRRARIKALKDRRKEILAEIEVENKRGKEEQKTTAKIAETSLSANLIVVVRTPAIEVKGRVSRVLAAALNDVGQTSMRVRKALKDQFALAVHTIESSAGAPRLLMPKERTAQDLEGMAALLLGRAQIWDLPNTGTFPRAAPSGRFAYLGLAMKSDGSRTSFPVLFDLDVQGPRHAIAIGASGSGKSYAASLIAEGALSNNVRVIVYDSTRSWTGFAEPSKLSSESCGTFGFTSQSARGFDTTVIEPRLADPPPTDELVSGKGIVVITPSHLTESEEKEVLEKWLTALYEHVAAMPESPKLSHLLVIEEAHRLKEHPRLVEILELFARTARVRGVGLLFVTQVLTDLAPGLRSQASTHLLLKTAYSQDLTRAGQIAGKEIQERIPALKQGTGFVHFADYGPPVLTAFRPPLHRQSAIPEAQLVFHRANSDLAKSVATLTRHVGGDEGATDLIGMAGAAQEGSPGLREGPAAATWRDIANRLLGRSSPEVRSAIAKAGLNPPSLRTIQRQLREVSRPHSSKVGTGFS